MGKKKGEMSVGALMDIVVTILTVVAIGGLAFLVITSLTSTDKNLAVDSTLSVSKASSALDFKNKDSDCESFKINLEEGFKLTSGSREIFVFKQRSGQVDSFEYEGPYREICMPQNDRDLDISSSFCPNSLDLNTDYSGRISADYCLCFDNLDPNLDHRGKLLLKKKRADNCNA